MAGMQHAAQGVRTRGHRDRRAPAEPASTHISGLPADEPSTCQRHHFAGGCAQLTMHHHAVVGRKLVGRRGTCGQAGHVLQRRRHLPLHHPPDHAQPGRSTVHWCMRRQAGMPIKRIKPLPNAGGAKQWRAPAKACRPPCPTPIRSRRYAPAHSAKSSQFEQYKRPLVACGSIICHIGCA